MIILTGASGGISKKLIDHLLKIDEVVGTYNKTSSDTLSKDRLLYEHLNLENPDDIKHFVKKLEKKIHKVTLIHAAALNIDGLTINYSEADWDRVMRINLRGNFLLTQALLPYMIQEKWGRIIHVSSVVGMEGNVGTLAYSASKAGLVGMSRVLAKEYARFNITSNVLMLGYFETGLIETLSDEAKKSILNQIPSKAFGEVENIANAIEFLIKSEYVSGSVISIDGGI